MLAFCGVAPACAETADGEVLAQQGDAVARMLFFGGADVWRNGYFSHGGFFWAPQGLNEDGPVLKLLLYGGLYHYQAGTTRITGEQLAAAALPGWRFKRDGLELTLFAGLDVQDHRFSPADPNRLRGTHAGARAGFDVWYEPLPDGMLTASASVSTVGTSYWTRAAAGWRVFDLWLGPEIHASGDDAYRQLRFGVHATSLRVWGYEWSAGAGWVTDTDRRDGMYGRIGVLVRK